MDFDNRKVYGDTSITDGLVLILMTTLAKRTSKIYPQVGASGDLAPLSHLALGLMGEGQMWSPSTGWGDAK